MIAIKTPENYLQQVGVARRVGEYVAPLASRILIITGHTAWRETGEAIAQSLQRHDVRFDVAYQQDKCTLASIRQLARQAGEGRAEGIIGIGGGVVMDTAKGVGELAGRLPLIQVPTVAATCAAWSPFSVLYDSQGAHSGSLPLHRYPVWILVDTEVIAATPVRFLKAGIVDALAKWFEFTPYLSQGEPDLGLSLQIQAAKMALDTFERDAGQALSDNRRNVASPALARTIDGVIALAGLANSVRDDSQRIGVAHAIHNSMTHHPALHGWLHGEKVGYALGVQAILQHDAAAESLPLLGWLERLDMPLSPQDLGIGDDAALLQQIAAGVNIKPEVKARLPFAVDEEHLAAALLATRRPARQKAVR
ncbi:MULTISPECIES: iron-containing alcohol dehydrogenase family protein [unclassified Brenneria]|uniref:iron-containing alcohol dehydrogenase family protein n=1 Tax=unclassified Brenneria TaxID=2634434 RepID=UPI0029C3D1A0|nr:MULTISPECIES: iron-containing alcohol dehydrogenase family protein [unclassified Brenneria]MDX5627540.1 iron-containing alcohol dehydrogenase family protein [Brenneria sp. L3-3Z]MDX5694304.1 iron-containing alcohol dehydrogenase family protein [Brenneria sp. L4-2C]MEE3662112.1 iron-containing alcohol dehydrogenase family protein [Brenneria sp. g21c3]